MESTTHISVVCVPATLAAGGESRVYLAGAGVMAGLGTALGWSHYARGWHATCTPGTPAAAVAASVALGLPAEWVATAIALAVPAAGGAQGAFGSSGKSLQVALREQLPGGVAVSDGIQVTTPASTVQPLIHHRPRTGLQGKFRLEYAIAAALLDPHPDFNRTRSRLT
jgi:2-methylcitrate dehydratase PrpD